MTRSVFGHSQRQRRRWCRWPRALATTAGQTYQLSFFLAADGEPGDLLRVSAGSLLLANLDGAPCPSNGDAWFSQYLCTFVASSAQTNLVFQYQSPIATSTSAA